MKKLFTVVLFFNMYCFSSESDLDKEISLFVLVNMDDSSNVIVTMDDLPKKDIPTQVSENNSSFFQAKSHENCLTQCYKKAELCFYLMTNYFTVNSQKKQ